MLTKKMLEDMPPGTIFATGTTVDCPDGINMTNSGKLLQWVAVRGKGIPDWAIYIHHVEHNIWWIRDHGDKIYFPHHIRKLIECDDEAFARYRF